MDAQERRDAAVKALTGCRMRKPSKHYLYSKAVIPFSHDRRHVSGAAYSQCKKKNAYGSRRLAEKVAERVMAERGYPVRVYSCHLCGCYHLSKKMLKPSDINALRGVKTGH